MVQESPGGTSFEDNDWNQGDSAYNKLLSSLKGIKKVAESLEVDLNFIFIDFHGESDGGTVSGANNFQTRQQAFYDNIQTDAGLTNLKYVMPLLSNNRRRECLKEQQ